MKIERLTTPVNKTAAVVTSQNGCTDDYTDEQRIENLQARWKRLESELETFQKGHSQRKFLGHRMQEVQIEINKIRPRRKFTGIEKHVMDILREDLTTYAFSSLIKKAIKRLEKSKKTR